MSSPHKQSKNRKGTKPRSHRRKNKLLNRIKPKYQIPIKKGHSKPLTPIITIKPNNDQLAEGYFNVLTKDLQTYYLGMRKNKGPYKSLLTQIERNLNNLDEVTYEISSEGKKEHSEVYKKIASALEKVNFPLELQKYSLQMQKKGLEKDLITNHFPQIISKTSH